MTKMMVISEIKRVANMNMAKHDDAYNRKLNGQDEYYIDFELEDGGYGSFDENQNADDKVEVNYD